MNKNLHIYSRRQIVDRMSNFAVSNTKIGLLMALSQILPFASKFVLISFPS